MTAGNTCSIHKPQNLNTGSDHKFKNQENTTCSSVFINPEVLPVRFWETMGIHFKPSSPMVGEMGSVSSRSHPVGIKAQDSPFRNSIESRTRIDIGWSIKALEHIYKFRNCDAVRTFLMDEPSASVLLSEAYGRIRKYFPDSEIFMEVVTDPDSPGEKELVVSIATDLSPKEAIKRLDAFDEDWWLDASDRSTASICIKVEYK